MIRFVRVPVGTGEPRGCALCGGERDAGYHQVANIADSIRIAQAAQPAGQDLNLLLTGPEPFDHPELPSVVSACVAAGARRLGLETDGGALSVRTNADGIVNAGVTHVWMRTLAADSTPADRLSGVPGLGAAARRGLEYYRDAAAKAGARVAVTALIPVCRHTLEHVPATIAALAAWGVDAVRLEPAGDLPGSASTTLCAACDTGMVNRLWVEVDPQLPLPASYTLHAVERRWV